MSYWIVIGAVVFWWILRQRRKYEIRYVGSDDLVGYLVKSKPEPPRCPRCGSYAWVYKGDRQVCADCWK